MSLSELESDKMFQYRASTIFVLFLTLFVMPQHSLSADTDVQEETLVLNLTAGTPKIELLRSETPNRELRDGERKEIESVFTFDLADAVRLFRSSRWVIGKDRFLFSPPKDEFPFSLSNTLSSNMLALRNPNFSLFGSVQTVGNPGQQNYELHARNMAPSGSVFTLDAIARKTDDGHLLHGVYSFSLRGFLQVGHVTLKLEGGLSQPPDFAMTKIPEPTTVAGIPLPSAYTVTISGTASGQEFSGVSGTLTLTTDPQSNDPGIQIGLTNGDTEHRVGDIYWSSSSLLG